MASAAVGAATVADRPASGALTSSGSNVQVLGLTGTSCASAADASRIGMKGRRRMSVDRRQAGYVARSAGRGVVVNPGQRAPLVVGRRAGDQIRRHAEARRAAGRGGSAGRAGRHARSLLAAQTGRLKVAVLVPASVVQRLRRAEQQALREATRARIGVVGR